MKPAPLPQILQRAGHDCATAAWKCVYYFHVGRNARILDLSHPIAGTDPLTLEAVIRRDAAWHVRSGETMIDDLKHYAETWRPPICLVTMPGETESHYIVVGGVWRGYVYYHCPCDGWGRMREAEFISMWHGLGRHRDFRMWSLTAWPVV